MARWRTLNKRARRRRKRDAQFVRDIDKLLAPTLEAVMRDAIKAAFTDLARSMSRMAEAWAKAAYETRGRWGLLDPKYARTRRRAWEWPDVVLEDILDAEYINEE